MIDHNICPSLVGTAPCDCHDLRHVGTIPATPQPSDHLHGCVVRDFWRKPCDCGFVVALAARRSDRLRPPFATDSPPVGIKHDQEKPRLDLLPFDALGAVAEVLTFGARKYADDNWRKVSGFRPRYLAAALRHLFAWRLGEKNDIETGFSHLAHAACCVLFLLARDGEPEAP